MRKGADVTLCNVLILHLGRVARGQGIPGSYFSLLLTAGLGENIKMAVALTA